MTMMAEGVTERSRAVWGGADFQPLAARNVLVGELLARAVDVRYGERVLDVAAGTGNTALAAARRGGRVTATDIVPAFLETASRRATVEGLDLCVEVADVQSLPFADDSFDVVLSSFGAMFAPDHRRAADELVRVCRPGGRIGLANFASDGLMTRATAVLAAHAPPAAQSGPPSASSLLWGNEQYVRGLFGTRIAALASTARIHEYCAASALAHVDLLRRHLGPIQAAFQRLDAAGQQQLAAALAAEFDRANRAADGTLVLVTEYVELVATVA